MIEGLKIKQTFAQNELQDGDVLTYQVEMSPEQYVIYSIRRRSLTYRSQDLLAQSLYASVPQYYDFLQNRVLVNFRPRYEDPTGRIAEFELMLSKKMTYEVVCHSL
jgi:ubiquitin carboxyl-terminal hydrolase 7